MIAAETVLGLSEQAFVALAIAVIALFGAGGPIVAILNARAAKQRAAGAEASARRVEASVGGKNGHGTIQDATGAILDRLDRMESTQHSMQTSIDSVVDAAGVVGDRLKDHDRELHRTRRRLDDHHTRITTLEGGT